MRKMTLKMPRRCSQERMFGKAMDAMVDVTALGIGASVLTGVIGSVTKK